MAYRKSMELTIGERDLETGEVKPVRLLVHPPTVDTVIRLTEKGDFNPLVLLAGLLERSDMAHGLDWLRANVEAEDLEAVKDTVTKLLGLERAAGPNVEGPQDQRTGG